MELDPKVVREVGYRAKGAIRSRMRSLRAALPERARESRSRLACQRVLELPEYREARGLALFASLPHEVSVVVLDQAARAAGKRVYYPYMDPTPDGFTTGFRRVDALTDLESRGRSFLEPPSWLPAGRRAEIDLVIVPALAVAPSGHRLGFGSGFYDATLPDICPPAKAVAIVFDFQLLAELPVEAHDFQVHVIVTDQRVLSSSEG